MGSATAPALEDQASRELARTHVLGRYELLLPIASGGMAMVWAARLRGTRGFQKIVAIKTILTRLSADPEFEQMFLDEAALASQIRHPHAVEILDLGEQDRVLYLVMEWIDGVPLNEVIREARKRGRAVPLPVAVRIAMQACAGLQAAHELRNPAGELIGLVHRDVSPQNILVTYGGVTKVVDFGIAKATALGDGSTGAGRVKGKIGYMAPEQIAGAAIDRRVDVFTMGIVLYTLTTGRHPFRGESETATVARIASEKPAMPPSQFVADYPPGLERVLLQALAKDPDERFDTANQLLRALDHALPASMRANTDEDVAAFIRSLFQERREQNREALARALQEADQRAARGGSADATRSLRQLLDSTRPAPVSSGELSGRTGPSFRPSLLPSLPPPSVPPRDSELALAGTLGAQLVPVGKRRTLLVGIAVAAAAVLIGLIVLVSASRRERTAPHANGPAPPALPEKAAAARAPEPVVTSEPHVAASAAPEPSARAEPSSSPRSGPSARPEPSSSSRSRPSARQNRTFTPPQRPRPESKPAPPKSWRHDPGF